MATLLPNGKQVFLDANGVPVVGGSVTFYVPGTSTLKDTYQDAAGTILNTNPVILDGSGNALIFGSGAYRQIVRDVFGNLIWDQYTSDTSATVSSWGGISSGTANVQTVAAPNFTNQDGQAIDFIAGFTNTGTFTLNGIPVKIDTINGPANGVGGEIVAGNSYHAVYDQIAGILHITPPVLPIFPRPVTEVLIEQFAGSAWPTVGTSTGVAGSGPDETSWTQAAINQAIAQGIRLTVSPGVHRTTNTLNAFDPLFMKGAIPPMSDSSTSLNTGTPANERKGSWFFFDHIARGLQIGNDHYVQSTQIEDLGFCRAHAAPGASSWVPIDSDYDIACGNCDVLLRNLLLLASNRGILHTYGGYGKFEAERVRGQFFKIMIRLDGEFDLPRIRDCHNWTFWCIDPYVQQFQRNNLEAIQFSGVDGVFLSDFFSISHNKALAYYEASGHSERVHQITNLYTDVGGTGIWIDVSVVDGVTLDICNWMSNHYVSSPGSTPPSSPGMAGWSLDVRGNGSEINVKNMRSEYAPEGIIRMNGSNNFCQADIAEAYKWNRNGSGSSAFECDTTNRLVLTSDIKIDGDTNATSANLITGAGVVKWPFARTSGTVAIPAATTTLAITHAQLGIPPNDRCKAWFTGNAFNSKMLWLNNFTPTTFNVNFDVAPGTNTSIAWEANIYG